jgi:ATP-dependent Lon protease
VKGGLDIVPVSRMDEVLSRALVRSPEPIVWDETAKPVEGPAAVEPAVEDEAALTAH